MDKEIRRILNAAEAAGWRLRDGRKHVMCFAPDGHSKVVAPKTPSDRRSILNTRADFRRAGLDV